MHLRISSCLLITIAALASTTSNAWALGFELGESEEKLKLDYEVSVHDHGTGRVTIKFILTDEGRLKPLNSIDFYIPSTDKHKSGGHMADLVLSLATREVDGKQVTSIHVKKELIEKAEIQLKTSHFDGKQEPLTWYYHSIPIAEYMKMKEQK